LANRSKNNDYSAFNLTHDDMLKSFAENKNKIALS